MRQNSRARRPYNRFVRERMLAVGCGGLCLLSVFAVLAGGLARVWQGESDGPPMWLIPLFLLLVGFMAFGFAIRRDRDDEDLFEGTRGVAVALSIVVIVVVTGFTVTLYFQPDFWRGLLEGSAR